MLCTCTQIAQHDEHSSGLSCAPPLLYRLIILSAQQPGRCKTSMQASPVITFWERVTGAISTFKYFGDWLPARSGLDPELKHGAIRKVRVTMDLEGNCAGTGSSPDTHALNNVVALRLHAVNLPKGLFRISLNFAQRMVWVAASLAYCPSKLSFDMFH